MGQPSLHYWKLAALALGLACALPGKAIAGDELARIQRERRDAESRHVAAEAACQRQFAVNSCLDQARNERRAVLEHLKGQQQVLDDSRRRERAAFRAQAIARKAEQTDARNQAVVAPSSRQKRSDDRSQIEQRDAMSPQVPQVPRAPRELQAPRTDTPAPAAFAPPVAGDRAKPPARAARAQASPDSGKSAKTERRRAEAERHRKAVLQRNADLESKRPKALGLPVPDAASAVR